MYQSTGEPPTIHPIPSFQEDIAFRAMENTNNNRNQQKKARNSSSLAPQEADSGYEASPSSTNENSTFIFDGQQHTGVSSSEHHSHNFEDSADHILIMDDSQSESDIDEGDLVDESERRTSLTNRWLAESSSVETTLEVGDDDEYFRPTSLPIPIPLRDDSSRFRLSCETSERGCLHVRSLPLSRVPEIPSPDDSPLSSSPTARFSMTVPLSWPRVTFRPILHSVVASRLVLADRPQQTVHRTTNRNLTSSSTNMKSRRRLIDSDASSFTSSEEGDAEVFDDVETPLVSSAPNSNGHLFLPDVIPQSSAVGSINSNGVRRHRSISVNLPLEEAVVEVGRNLRRLSDQFDDQIRRRHNRRYTIGDILRFNMDGERFRRYPDDDDSVPRNRWS